MSEATKNLDPDELLHLAVRASDQNATGQAIAYLKEAIEKRPDFAQAFHLLGAEHAQLGMYERAMADMEKAIAIDPQMAITRFQLGLLYLGARQPDKAVQVWSPLDDLGELHALYQFKKGLTHLAKDEFRPCLIALKRGIELNTFSQSLNVDMTKFIHDVEPHVGDDDDQDKGHLFLSAYNGETPKH